MSASIKVEELTPEEITIIQDLILDKKRLDNSIQEEDTNLTKLFEKLGH